MTDNNAVRRIAVLLTVLLVAAAVAPSAAAAAPVIETSSTEVDDGTDIADFNASADETYTVTLNASDESSDPGIKISRNDSDVVFYENESGENVSGNDLWNFTFSQADLADVPMNAEENVTMDLTYYNQSNETDSENVQFYLNSTNERAVIYVGDDEADEDVDSAFGTEATIESDEPLFGLLSESTTASVEHDDLEVDGTDTTVYVVFANSSVESAYADALDRKWFGQSSYDAEDYVKFHQVYLNGLPQLVFNEEAPDAIVDNEDFSHGVFTEVDGHDAIEVTLGEEDFDDEDELDVETTGNDPYSFFQHQQNRWANLMAGR